MNRIYPFKGKNSVGNKWYDKIGISASANARNDISGSDSTIFTEKSLKQMRNGVMFNAPISTNLNVLKYFTLTPLINTSGKMYFQSIRKNYNTDTKQIIYDTISETRFAYDYSFSMGLSTRIYGDYMFKTKRLKQIRHVITPNINASYRPDFSEQKYGYYRSLRMYPTGKTQRYSIFEQGMYGSPQAGKAGIIGFNVNNSLEAKKLVKSDSGSVTKKLKIIESFNASVSYNIAAKQYKWSDINLNGRTRVFNLIDVNASANLTPYQMDSIGNRIERYEWNNGKIGRLTNANLALGTSLRSKEGKKEKKTDKGTQEELDYVLSHPEAFVDFNVPWNINIYYNFNYSKILLKDQITQTVTLNGDLSLTQKWKVSVTSGYDFTLKDFTLTSVSIYRDLHCWEMRFNWVPFGLRQSFSIDINVKSAVLKDLKLSRRKDWFDYQ